MTEGAERRDAVQGIDEKKAISEERRPRGAFGGWRLRAGHIIVLVRCLKVDILDTGRDEKRMPKLERVCEIGSKSLGTVVGKIYWSYASQCAG